MGFNELEIICKHVLFIANQTLNKIGRKGKEEDIGEDIIVTKGDNAVSRAMADSLKLNLPEALIQSEEGKVINSPKNPEFRITFDEIDGTFNYHRGILPYSTVITALEYSENPVFDDVIFGGVLNHTNQMLYYAVKNKGCFASSIDSFVRERIQTSKRKSLNEKGIVSTVIDLGPHPKLSDFKRFSKYLKNPGQEMLVLQDFI